VSTAVLLFTRGAQTTSSPQGKDIWFYDMAHDGFSLDDKRTPVEENDIPDVIQCWTKRFDADFGAGRTKRISDLRRQLTPLKTERLQLQAEINRLQFESVLGENHLTAEHAESAEKNKRISADSAISAVNSLANAQARLAELQSKIENPQSELDRLTRQFWVTKEQVKANKYDLSASRYRQVDADAVYHEKPSVTLERLARLESVMLDEIKELGKLVNGK
jgi:type I restriction enzyme M protein